MNKDRVVFILEKRNYKGMWDCGGNISNKKTYGVLEKGYHGNGNGNGN